MGTCIKNFMKKLDYMYPPAGGCRGYMLEQSSSLNLLKHFNSLLFIFMLVFTVFLIDKALIFDSLRTGRFSDECEWIFTQNELIIK